VEILEFPARSVCMGRFLRGKSLVPRTAGRVPRTARGRLAYSAGFWISAESPGVVDLFGDVDAPYDALGTQASVLGLVRFDNGKTATELLGFVHPHGNWVDWRAS
jgi:hypothetical protein